MEVETLNIVVCLKQILDPEIAVKDFKIDENNLRPIIGNAKMVMDSFAENSLEVAIQLREKYGGQVTAICVGDKPSDDVLRRACALTADTAVRVWDPEWSGLDAGAVAHVLARTIQKLGGADLILCGRQAGDIERGLVGSMLAEELGATCVTMVNQIEQAGDLFRCETDGGFKIVESQLPDVACVTSADTNVPRLPKVKDMMKAARMSINLFSAADLNLESTQMQQYIALQELYIPVQTGICELLEGDDGPAKAVELTSRLKELKIL